jgi:integrase
VALAVGLRLGEALGLKWDDIDLVQKELRVRHALQRSNGKLRLVEPKSERSRRSVSLPNFAVAALRQHRASQLQDRLAAGGSWQETGFVFTSSIGTPLEGSNVWKAFRALLDRAGLPQMRIHDLRHTCASLLLAQGVHQRLVMETLGHSQISLMMDTYSHVLPALHAEVAAKMDAVLKSGRS